MSSKLWRNVALAGVAAAGAAVWAVAPRTFNDKRRNFVPSIPEVWYAHRGLHDAYFGSHVITCLQDFIVTYVNILIIMMDILLHTFIPGNFIL